ncbi:MAG TPA: RDD family protein [Kineosporiaceae bacterium]|nr:RDD family protein [Kineosporiaceae bacterium]
MTTSPDPVAGARATPDTGWPPPPTVASLGVRLLARLVDAVVIGAALIVVWSAANLLGSGQGLHYDSGSGQLVDGDPLVTLTAKLLTVLLLAGYEPLLVATQGATIGKRMLRVRVLRRSDGSLPGWGPAVLRWLVPALGVLICGAGELLVYASALLDGSGYNRGWHDRIAGTVVVRE